MPAIMANIQSQKYEAMEGKFLKIVGYLKSQGIDKFTCIGFCWGVWFAFKMAAKFDCFKGIMGPHPSLGVQGLYGGTPSGLAEQIKCPAYLMPAGNDPDDVKEKG